MRRPRSGWLLWIALVGLAGVAAASCGQERRGGAGPGPASRASAFEGSPLPPRVHAPDFSLKNQDGKPITMRALRGQPVIVTFLYTRCRETCPAQAQQVKLALDQLERPVPAIAISVDPRHDTAPSARRFLARQRVAGAIDFVLGSLDELAPVWRGYAIAPQSPNQEHQARIVLVDRRGRQRVAFPFDQATPERIAHDVRALSRESRYRTR